MAADAEVLLECLDCSFTKSICLRVVGGRKARVDVELSVKLFKELRGKLRTKVQSNMSW